MPLKNHSLQILSSPTTILLLCVKKVHTFALQLYRLSFLHAKFPFITAKKSASFLCQALYLIASIQTSCLTVSFHFIFGLPKFLLRFGIQYVTRLTAMLSFTWSKYSFHYVLLGLLYFFTGSFPQSSLVTELYLLMILGNLSQYFYPCFIIYLFDFCFSALLSQPCVDMGLSADLYILFLVYLFRSCCSV